jgi:multicomponent Na+:H+ antiporter subunit D
MTSVAPFVVFYVGAVAAALTRGTVRSAVLLAVPLLCAGALIYLPSGTHGTYDLLGHPLILLRVDTLSLLFGYLFVLAAFLCILFSLHLEDTVQHVSALLYAGSALGAVFSGDLISFFIFWEILAVTSAFLILARRTERARRAAMRYLLVQVSAGLLLLAGVVFRIHEGYGTGFDAISLDGVGGWLIFLALGVKCGFPLLHNWLTDTYPEATPTGTVFLSAFTTKVAVYALARGFAGAEYLIYVGAVMTMFPIFYAVIENDLRRVLSYSMINQIGFMVVGIGLGTDLALNGAVSHAFNDVVFKALMLMSMGAVLFRTGRIDASALGGLYKSMPWSAAFCIVGAASISAFPLFSGFVSKSMVMEAALQEGHPWVWLALLFASAGVLEHAGIKVPFFAFFAHDSGIRTKEAPLNMLLAMGLAAAICIFNGSYPWLLYSLLPWPVAYDPYSASHVLTVSQLLFFAILAFCVLKLTGLYPPELPSVNLDFDWFYRRALPRAAQALLKTFRPLDRRLRQTALAHVERVVRGLLRHHGPRGALARTWPTGSMVLWAAALLAAFAVVYYFR